MDSSHVSEGEDYNLYQHPAVRTMSKIYIRMQSRKCQLHVNKKPRFEDFSLEPLKPKHVIVGCRFLLLAVRICYTEVIFLLANNALLLNYLQYKLYTTSLLIYLLNAIIFRMFSLIIPSKL